MLARLVRAWGEERYVRPTKGEKFSLSELQTAVGGNIEIVRLSKNLLMVLDEEGKLKDKPLNLIATRLYRVLAKIDDYIVGDVLIVPAQMID